MVKVLKRRNLNISVPEELVEWLDQEAATQGRSRNNLINWILNQHRKKDTKT
jgi:predicted HicB family RNase H-like nuclease